MKKAFFFTIVSCALLVSPLKSQNCGCSQLPFATLTQAGQTAINTSGDTRLVVSNNNNSNTARAYFTMFGPSTSNPSRAGEFGIAGSYVRFFTGVTPGGFGTEQMRLTTDGKLGIGTTNPQSLLSVKGSMESQEVQVKATVADYVFKDDYQLLSLEEIENYINEKGHLPKIQNDADVKANRGYVKIGELSISLMEKVEELTLHMIEMNKRVKALEKENNELKKQLEDTSNK